MTAATTEIQPALATIPKGTRLTGAVRALFRAELVAVYESGASIRAIAEETGRSYGAIHRLLTESGADISAKGGKTR